MDAERSHADPAVHEARRRFSSALESNVLDYLHYGAPVVVVVVVVVTVVVGIALWKRMKDAACS